MGTVTALFLISWYLTIGSIVLGLIVDLAVGWKGEKKLSPGDAIRGVVGIAVIVLVGIAYHKWAALN